MAGVFGEILDDLHDFVQKLAETRLAKVGLQAGRQGGAEELGAIVGQIRRHPSVTIVGAHADCLLSRLNMVGEGSREASKRRRWAEKQERDMERERRGQFLARVRGHGPGRPGRIHF